MKPQPIQIVVVLILCAASFFGGTFYQSKKTPTFNGNFNRTGNPMMMRPGTGSGQTGGPRQMGFRPVSGEVISVDDKTITVKLTDGSSKNVYYSDKTTVNKAQQATIKDILAGTKIAVFGNTGTDGSVTANSIQIDPTLMMMDAPKPAN